MIRASLIMAGLALAAPAVAQTADQVKELQAKYRAERAAAAGQRAPAPLLEAADRYAARGDAALAAGELPAAAAAYRDARWRLPAPPADLPEHVARVLGSARLRHADIVYAVAFSPDGQRLASASKDGTVRVWELATGRELRVYRGHNDPVRAVAWAGTGSFVASAAGKEVHLWNPETGRTQRKLTEHTAVVNAVAVRPDGKQVATGGDDKKLLVWDVENTKVQHDLSPQQDAILSLAYSPNGKLIAAGTKAGAVSVWNPDGDPRTPLNVSAHSEGANQVVFSPDGTQVATAGDRLAKVLGGPSLEGKPNDRTGTQLFTFTGHGGQVTCVAFSKDGKYLATGSVDRTIRVWEVAAGNKVVRDFQGHAEQVTAVAFSPDGTQLASAGMDQAVRLWGMQPADAHRSFDGHTGYVWSAVMRPDGKQLASGGADRAVKLWDVATGKEQHTLTGHKLPITTVVYSPNGEWVLSCGGDKLLKLWDANGGQFIRDLAGHESAVMAAAFSADGRFAVSGAADRTAIIWDPASGKPTGTLKGHRAAVSAVAVRPDGKQIATGSADGAVKLWDAEKKEETAGFQAQSLGVGAAAYSPDGTRLATCGGDGKVKVWDLAGQTPTLLVEFGGHSGPVSSVAFSPDGKLLTSGGADAVVKVWSLQSRADIRSLRGHGDWIGSVAFSKDGRNIVSAGVDRSVKVWEYLSDDGAAAAGHTRGVSAVAVSADGRWIATAAYDRMVKVWDAATGLERLTLPARSEEVLSLAFAADGSALLAGGVDGKIAGWALPDGKELKPVDEKARVPALVVLPDGKRYVAWLLHKGDAETVSHLLTFETATGNKVDTYNDRRGVSCLAFSADGELAASGDGSGTVRIVHVAKRERVRGDLPAHAKALADIAITPDKKTLITADEDSELKIWDLAKREPLHTVQAHKGNFGGVAVSADGGRFATTDRDGQVRVWETKTGNRLREWELKMSVRGLAFTPDGKQLATANGNGTVYLLELP